MQIEHSQKGLVDPYRTLAIFNSGPVALSKSRPAVLTAPAGSSFRVYSEQLGLKVVAPPLGDRVLCAVSYNEFTYVRVGQHILKMKYHHVVKKWEVGPFKGSTSSILLFDNLIILC